jgi:hypothetical protein
MLGKMQPLLHVADPFERLKALGLVYIEFANKNKDFYDRVAPASLSVAYLWR